MLANDVGKFFVRKVEHIGQDTDKIAERAVFDQLYTHVMNNELFPSCSQLTGNRVELRRRWLR